jgi:hypothetical protein
MRPKLLWILGAVGLAIALLMVGDRSAPTARADPSTTFWDVVLDDPDTGTGHCVNNNDNVANSGECVTVIVNTGLQSGNDNGSLPIEQGFFDLSLSRWGVSAFTSTGAGGSDLDGDTTIEAAEKNALWPVNGLGAVPGGAITKGAIASEIGFHLHSNVVLAGGNNVCTSTGGVCGNAMGQPPEVSASVSAPPLGGYLGDTFQLFNAELSTAAGKLISFEDLDKDGLRETEDDNYLTDGTLGQDGLRDGVDLTPSPIKDFLADLALPGVALTGRGFGDAKLLNLLGNIASNDVNFLVISQNAVGQEGYINLSLVGYPFVAATNPWPLTGSELLMSAVITSAPFRVTVTDYGITQANNAEVDLDFDGDIDTNGPDIAGGEISRRLVGTGTFPYAQSWSVGDDYDSDNIAGTFDLCDTNAAGGRLASDTDGDGTVLTCDINGEGTNPVGALGHSNCPDTSPKDGQCDVNVGFNGWHNVLSQGQDFDRDDPPGDVTGDGCPGICGISDDGDATIDTDGANANDDDEDGVADENNYVGDGRLNRVDNCAALPDIDIDNADGDYNATTGVDFQLDTDGDSIGDLCDKAPGIPGDGTSSGLAGSSHDMDSDCNDAFTIGNAEGTGGGTCVAVKDANDDSENDLSDPNNNGVYDPGEYDADDNSDNGAQGVEHAGWNVFQNNSGDYASDACEAFLGTNPLNAGSSPVGNTYRTFTVGGSLAKMDCDGDTTADASDSTPFPGMVDADQDGCTAWEEKGTDMSAGGLRSDARRADFYDFTDITQVIDSRDKAVSGFDLNVLLAYINSYSGDGGLYDGHTNGNPLIKDGTLMDFSSLLNPWPNSAGDGAISGFDLNDLLAQLNQSCGGAP